MARRRKSPSINDFTGILFMIGLVVVAGAVNYVYEHPVGIALTVVSVGAVWLGALMARRKNIAGANQPASVAKPHIAQRVEARRGKPEPRRQISTQASSKLESRPPMSQISPKSSQLPDWDCEVCVPQSKSSDAAQAEPPPEWDCEVCIPQPKRSDAIVRSANQRPPEPEIRITPIEDKPNLGLFGSWFKNEPRDLGSGKARWVRPGEVVTIHGIDIRCGLFYFGTKLQGQYSRNESFLINPKLKVAEQPSVANSQSGAYLPCDYADLTPPQRRLFLEWMAGGRRNKEIGDAAIRLFLDGLQHRIFVEGITDDIHLIIRELEELVDFHRFSRSFWGDMEGFLSYVNCLLPDVKRPHPLLAKIPNELSPQVRVYIGRKLSKNETLTAEDALVWALAVPDVWLRTPVTRCFNEFEQLWSIRFAETYRGRLAVRMPRRKISLFYRATFSTLTVPIHGGFEEFPDIAGSEQTAVKLKELVEACTSELEAYSRVIGRMPEAAGSARADFLLPESLWAQRHSASIEKLVAFSATERPVANLGALLKNLDLDLEVATQREWINALDRFSSVLRPLGIGIEPDGSHSAVLPTLETLVTVFRIGGGKADVELNAELDWRRLIEIGVQAAGDAGRKSAAEALLQKMPGLDEGRLAAFALVAESNSNRISKFLKLVRPLSDEKRRTVADCAVSIVVLGNAVSPQSVKSLEKLFKGLNLPASELYAALHRGGGEKAAPDAARPTTPTQEDNRVAAPVVIDEGKLASALESTRTVSKLLADVFAEQEPSRSAEKAAVAPSSQPPDANLAALPGLDAAHAALLSALLDEGGLSRKDFEAQAKELKLFADGAIEHINEWAFDRFDQPAIEDGDPVAIAAETRDRLLEMRGKGE